MSQARKDPKDMDVSDLSAAILLRCEWFEVRVTLYVFFFFLLSFLPLIPLLLLLLKCKYTVLVLLVCIINNHCMYVCLMNYDRISKIALRWNRCILSFTMNLMTRELPQ